ncbi:hypothetical protein [Nocardia sp. CY41]|uniref:hypothetical protein n=1 Tax=Nocardia sp. CY41 TaxID=2608686 RepID=UPI00135A1D63|nr:hypothetical protein [Nocardia sp. CY41]
MRTYLPSGGPSAAELPEVTVPDDSTTRILPACPQPARTPALDAAMRAVAAAGLPLRPRTARDSRASTPAAANRAVRVVRARGGHLVVPAAVK